MKSFQQEMLMAMIETTDLMKENDLNSHSLVTT